MHRTFTKYDKFLRFSYCTGFLSHSTNIRIKNETLIEGKKNDSNALKMVILYEHLLGRTW